MLFLKVNQNVYFSGDRTDLKVNLEADLDGNLDGNFKSKYKGENKWQIQKEYLAANNDTSSEADQMGK